jgi:NADH dehydrogenase FAD-containing subunit
MGEKMLGTYDQLISDYCRETFQRMDINMLMGHRVTKVNPTSVEVVDVKTGESKTISFGMCVWASGIRPNSVSLELAKKVQGTRMLEVDPCLRVRGAEGSMFALGDCAKITQPKLVASAGEWFEKFDKNKDGYLSEAEFKVFIEQTRKEKPHLQAHLGHASAEALFRKSTTDPIMTRDLFEKTLAEVDSQLKMLPPTAQVATQQGCYLAKVINTVKFEELGNPDGFTPTFEYKHAGSMVYLGSEKAGIEMPVMGASNVMTGVLTYIIWKGVYWSKSLSGRAKFNLIIDWARSWFLGRDTSRF